MTSGLTRYSTSWYVQEWAFIWCVVVCLSSSCHLHPLPQGGETSIDEGGDLYEEEEEEEEEEGLDEDDDEDEPDPVSRFVRAMKIA